MATLSFYLRASKCGDDTPSRLCLRVIHRRKSKTLAVPCRLYPHEWDELSRQVITDTNDPMREDILKEAAEYILQLREKFEEINTELSSRIYYTVDDVYSLLCPPERTKNSLTAYTTELCRELEKTGHERTARGYRSSLNKLLDFTRTKDISFEDITSSLVKVFEESLKASGKSLNTISFYMRGLRAIHNRAIEEGVAPQCLNPFKGVFTGFHKTCKRALDTDRMQRIQELPYSSLPKENKQPDDKGELQLYTAWRYFIFCFHARGMCFVDLAYLRKDNIRGGVIHYYRKKTGGLIEVKITPAMQSILDSFSRDVRNSPYLFPIITVIGKKERLQYETGLRRQNRLLKELACKAGLTVKLSTHVARHSWASIAKVENLPLWVISEGLGHTSEKTTYTYLAQLERSRLDRANEIICTAVSRRADP